MSRQLLHTAGVEVSDQALHDGEAESRHGLLESLLHLESDLFFGLESRVELHGRKHRPHLHGHINREEEEGGGGATYAQLLTVSKTYASIWLFEFSLSDRRG